MFAHMLTSGLEVYFFIFCNIKWIVSVQSHLRADLYTYFCSEDNFALTLHTA